MKPIALVMVPISPMLTAGLEERFTLLPAFTPPEREAAIAQQASAIALMITNGTTGCTAEQMDALPKLRLISALGVGYEKVDVEAAKARGILVSHGPGTNDSCVADHAMALLMAVARGIPMADAAVRQGKWMQMRTPRPSIFGKRLGIFGLGRIGLQIAQRAAGGFNMSVAYTNRNQRSDVDYPYHASLRDLAEAVDFLILVAPGGAGTHHLVDAGVLQALGPQGFLINVGRGSIVDGTALAAALQAGTIAGAALDVLEHEPEVPADLLAAPNLIFTPHMAGRSPESHAAVANLVLRNVAAAFDGQALVSAAPGSF